MTQATGLRADEAEFTATAEANGWEVEHYVPADAVSLHHSLVASRMHRRMSEVVTLATDKDGTVRLIHTVTDGRGHQTLFERLASAEAAVLFTSPFPAVEPGGSAR